jgi:hypothetical protein
MKANINDSIKKRQNGIAEHKDIQSVLSSNPMEKELEFSILSYRKIIISCKSMREVLFISEEKIKGRVSVFSKIM